MLRRVAALRLDPQSALVVLVQHVLPGEADAAVHLDRALARVDRGVAAVGFRGSARDVDLLVFLGDAPGSPVRKRAGELHLDVRVRKLVRDRLVRTDRLAELLARLRVLDRELERLGADPDRLERERRELLVLRRSRLEELLAAIRTAGLLVQHRAVEEAALREHVASLAPQQLLVLRERELHPYRPLGRPSTRSAMMLRRISDVPASIVLPRERSCW